MNPDKHHQRMPSRTVTINAEFPDPNGGEPIHHPFEVSFAWDQNNRVQEIVFVGRGKVGHGLDHILHNIGPKISRALQGRDPETGDSTEREAWQAEPKDEVL